jgi:hypothetical protein
VHVIVPADPGVGVPGSGEVLQLQPAGKSMYEYVVFGGVGKLTVTFAPG